MLACRSAIFTSLGPGLTSWGHTGDTSPSGGNHVCPKLLILLWKWTKEPAFQWIQLLGLVHILYVLTYNNKLNVHTFVLWLDSTVVLE